MLFRFNCYSRFWNIKQLLCEEISKQQIKYCLLFPKNNEQEQHIFWKSKDSNNRLQSFHLIQVYTCEKFWPFSSAKIHFFDNFFFQSTDLNWPFNWEILKKHTSQLLKPKVNINGNNQPNWPLPNLNLFWHKNVYIEPKILVDSCFQQHHLVIRYLEYVHILKLQLKLQSPFICHFPLKTRPPIG